MIRFGRQSLLGIRRLLRQSEEENLPWNPARRTRSTAPAHDASADPQTPQRDNYFTPSRFYCVETLCCPCGVVIAWAKFDKSESPTKILEWLETIYPDPASRPDYICIDKACLVLKKAVTSGKWATWRKTTRFIVDSYHYINHRATDALCRKWCNPAPLDGSAPNLVLEELGNDGQWHYKRAFNTQVRLC